MKRLLLILLLLPILYGCSVAFDYSDFPEITLSDPNQQLTQPESVYYLYFFEQDCPACNSVKQEVLSKIESLRNDKVYLCEVVVYGSINSNISVNYIPAIVRIVNNEVDAVYEKTSGVIPIIETLS